LFVFGLVERFTVKDRLHGFRVTLDGLVPDDGLDPDLTD
jgi:hypothetical protein